MDCDVAQTPCLYVVATPIGNLGDITLRAIEVLKSADIAASEDTRTTGVLFERYGISTRLISYHKFSEHERADLFLKYLQEGKTIALVSDAGTPLISDPGCVLVETVLNAGYRVVPIVGATAIAALLSATPRKDEDFKFVGFLPRSENQIRDIVLKNNSENLIFYESPKRLPDTLEIVANVLPDKKISVGRELTKKFEEIKIGSVSDILKYFRKNTLKGEFVCLLHKSNEQKNDYTEQIKKLKTLGFKDKEIAAIIASLYGANKNDIYKKCLEIS